jgi:hypothetical protein
MTPIKPGTIVFCRSTDAIGKIIRFGERLRWTKGSEFNHVAIVDRVDEDGTAYVIQAEARGVTDIRKLEEIAPGGSYELVKLPKGVKAEAVLNFARRQVGVKYGYATIAAIAIDILTPSWFPSLRPANKNSNSWICSAIAGEALRCGGWYHQWPDIYLVTPAQLYAAMTGND